MRAAEASGLPLAVERLVKTYLSPSGETQALRGVEARFEAATVTCISGPSGSGKSTLLSLLSLLERPSAGVLTVLGTETSGLGRRQVAALRARALSLVPQRPVEALYPHLSAEEQLRCAVRRSGEAPQAVARRVGLEHRLDARVRALSGGEQQRLAVAAAAATGKPVLIADEPTAELDDETAALVSAELRRRAEAGVCVVVATHDDRVSVVADRVLALRHGVLAEERARGSTLAPIDSAGRVQLTREALALFPGQRAEVVVVEGEVRLRPPRTDEP